jgi:hypothetical protein
LTDVVEARLGTDPRRADTDGDGVADAVDPCPNAAPRPLTDDEKIIAAAVRARFFEEDWSVPAVISVEGIRPFELTGYPRALIWEQGRTQGPLGKMYAGGVNVIGFQPPEAGDPERRAKLPKEVIRYSADKKTAHTIISRYSGGLNGDGIEVTLKKIGDEWFVIDLQGRYVS